jgi:hypothetical protein
MIEETPEPVGHVPTSRGKVDYVVTYVIGDEYQVTINAYTAIHAMDQLEEMYEREDGEITGATNLGVIHKITSARERPTK